LFCEGDLPIARTSLCAVQLLLLKTFGQHQHKKKLKIKYNIMNTEDNKDKDLQAESTSAETAENATNTGNTTGNEAEDCEDLLAKERDRYLRLFAEFENYKKRTSRERIELFKTAGQDILSALLPVVDDFDRALADLATSADEQTRKGVELIYNKLIGILKNKGLERIEVAANDAFDSELHDAITQIPAPTPEMSGKIIDVVQQGYKLGDKIIRFPRVVVAQ
jgi:grpE